MIIFDLGDKVTVKIGKEGSKDYMKKVLKKDQVSIDSFSRL